jgi:hypothetical protein
MCATHQPSRTALEENRKTKEQFCPARLVIICGLAMSGARENRRDKNRLCASPQEVYFKQLAQSLWLPKDVTVTVDWGGKTLRNDHQYSDFERFNVGADENITKRKNPKPIAHSQTAHK